MSTAVQLRRGTTAEHASFTGAVGEVTVDTTKDTIVVHDGVLEGGHPLLKEAAVDVTVAAITSNSGSLKLPAGTELERDGSPAAGYLRFNEDAGGFEGYNGVEWGAVGGGNSTDSGFWLNKQLIEENQTIPTGYNATSTGPITVDDGVEVTVADGSRWVIL
jgi:hypothetical protein